jgi:hypothetical protein
VLLSIKPSLQSFDWISPNPKTAFYGFDAESFYGEKTDAMERAHEMESGKRD